MWISNKVFDLFEFSKETIVSLRQELSTARLERDILRNQVTTLQVTSDWLRMKVNQLELERAALLEKAYDIKLPAPEIMRRQAPDPQIDLKQFSFDDMGDIAAKTLGLPTYN